MRRGDNLAHGLAGHHVAGIDRLRVGLLLAQPAAHVGVDGQPDGARHHLAGGGLRDGILADVEVLAARRAIGRRFSTTERRVAAFWLIVGSMILVGDAR